VGNAQPGGYYFAPPSHWPIVGSTALLLMAIGGVLMMNSLGGGGIVLGIGAAILVYMLFGWFGAVIRESEGGLFNKQVDMSFRWSMSWFIFSEVMFFAAFFGALFYARVYSVPWLADLDNRLGIPLGRLRQQVAVGRWYPWPQACIRGRHGACMKKKPLMRQRSPTSVVAREVWPADAGAAAPLPQPRPHAHAHPAA